MLRRLRKRGNFIHNMEVLKAKKGIMVVEKRHSSSQLYIQYLPSEFCFAFYHKSDLRFHVKRCPERPEGFIVGRHVQPSASMLLYSDSTASTDLSQILFKMKVVEISMCVKSDSLMTVYGNLLCRKLKKEGDQQHHISNKIRELARLVIETRKCCNQVQSIIKRLFVTQEFWICC